MRKQALFPKLKFQTKLSKPIHTWFHLQKPPSAIRFSFILKILTHKLVLYRFVI